MTSTADKKRAQLIEWFGTIGESSVEYAADQELKGGAYLPRALFLRGVVRALSDRCVDHPKSLEYPGGTKSLERLLQAGAAPDDLRLALRAAQWQSLWQLVCLLDDSRTGVDDLQKSIGDHVEWKLFRVDEDGKPLVALKGLHEDLLDYLETPAAAPKTDATQKSAIPASARRAERSAPEKKKLAKKSKK